MELDLYFNEGISYAGGLLDGALKYGFLEKTGSWYSYNGEKIGQGRDNAITFLKQNPDVMSELDGRLRVAMFGSSDTASQPASSDEQ